MNMLELQEISILAYLKWSKRLVIDVKKLIKKPEKFVFIFLDITKQNLSLLKDLYVERLI